MTRKHLHTCTRPLRALRETLDLSNRNVLSRFDNFDFMTRPNERKGRLFGVAGGGTLLLQAPMSDLMSLAALMTSLPPRAALIQCQTHFILLTAIQWRAADNIIFINDCRQVENLVIMDVGDGLDIWIVSGTLNQPRTQEPVYQGTDS